MPAPACHRLLMSEVPTRSRGYRVRVYRLSLGFEPCWVIWSHSDLMNRAVGPVGPVSEWQ